MKIFYSLLFFASIFIHSQYYVGKDKSFQEFASPNSYPFSPLPDGSYFLCQNQQVVKFLSDGKNDQTFGNSGSIGTSYTYQAPQIYTKNQALYVLIESNKISKYDYNGVKDISFGTNGTLVININSSIYGIEKIEDDGSLYLTFSDGIRKVLPTGNADQSTPLLPKGSIINNSIINNGGSVLTKYNLDGSVDQNFGSNGTLPFPTGVQSFKISATGDIYFYKIDETISIWKHFANGTLDQSFGESGIATISQNDLVLRELIIDSENQIILYGGNTSIYTAKANLLRLTKNGGLDYSFNNGNYSSVNRGSGLLSCKSINDNQFLCSGLSMGGAGNIVYSMTKILRTQNPDEVILSVHDIDSESKVSIYPNPVKDIFDIKLSSNENLQTVKLFDASGKLILTSRSTKNNISQLNKGIYYLEVTTSSNTYKTKIIKN